MKKYFTVFLFFLTLFLFSSLNSQTRPRIDWGAPLIDVSQSYNLWIIAGQKRKVTFNDSNFSISIIAGPVNWFMAASEDNDMIVKSMGEKFNLKLTSAEKIDITKYDTGYKTGIKIKLSKFTNNGMLNRGLDLDLTLVLTICLEGDDEDLVCDAVAPGSFRSYVKKRQQ